MREEWREIDENKNYLVSNTGKVKGVGWHMHNKPLSPKEIPSGYVHVCLGRTGGEKAKYRYIHRLVAKAFVPNPQKKRCVNHIDGDKKNNHANNLEWVTYSENMQKGIKAGHLKWNKAHHGAKLTEEDVRDIRTLEGVFTCKQVADLWGVAPLTIYKIFKRRTWKHVK